MIIINYALDFAFVGSDILPCKYVYFGCEYIALVKYDFIKSCKPKSKYLKFYKECNDRFYNPGIDITMDTYFK